MPVTNNSVKSVTISPAEWQNWQNAQRAAQRFIQSAEGPTGKTRVNGFQTAFNTAAPALVKIIEAKGGDASKSFSVIPGGVPLKVDSLYGVSTNRALALVVMFSFPNANAKLAAADLLEPPITRTRVALWNKHYASFVNNMISADYSAEVQQAQNPVYSNANGADNLRDYASSQTNTQNAVNAGKDPDLSAQTTSTTSKPEKDGKMNQNPYAGPINLIDEPEIITAAPPKSYSWVWWALGLSGLAGGLYWAFGKKLRA